MKNDLFILIKSTMQKHFLKFGKVFTNVAFSPLILISNISELAAKYLPNDVDQSIETLEIPNINNVLFQGIDIKKEKKFLFAENNNDVSEEKCSYLRNNYRRLGKSS